MLLDFSLSFQFHFICVLCVCKAFCCVFCPIPSVLFPSCGLVLLTSLTFPPRLSCMCLISSALFPVFLPSLLSLRTCTASPPLAKPCSQCFSSLLASSLFPYARGHWESLQSWWCHYLWPGMGGRGGGGGGGRGEHCTAWPQKQHHHSGGWWAIHLHPSPCGGLQISSSRTSRRTEWHSCASKHGRKMLAMPCPRKIQSIF